MNFIEERRGMIIRIGEIGFMEVSDSFTFQRVKELAFDLAFNSNTYLLQRDKQDWQAWGEIQALKGGCTEPFRELWQARRGFGPSFLLGTESGAMLHNRHWLPPLH